MKSLVEVVADLNAVKTERSHTRIVVPDDAQADENYRLIGALLEGTGIDQSEVAALSLDVGHSAVQTLDQMGPDGGIDAIEMIGLIGSLWLDGVIVGARYMAQHSAIRPEGLCEATDGSNGVDPTESPDPSRAASQDDPRGERDR